MSTQKGQRSGKKLTKMPLSEGASKIQIFKKSSSRTRSLEALSDLTFGIFKGMSTAQQGHTADQQLSHFSLDENSIISFASLRTLDER